MAEIDRQAATTTQDALRRPDLSSRDLAGRRRRSDWLIVAGMLAGAAAWFAAVAVTLRAFAGTEDIVRGIGG
jgi:hypothetical protein